MLSWKLSYRFLTKSLAVLLMASLYLMTAAPLVKAVTPLQVTGQVVSTGNIVVNSNNVTNGATVVPNSRITVPTGVQASINLGSLGKVDIQPCSDFTLDFTGNSVNVNLNYGTVTLNLAPGSSGEIRMPGTARVRVVQGEVSVRTDAKTETLTAGRSKRITNATLTAGSGGSTLTVEGTGQYACVGGKAPDICCGQVPTGQTASAVNAGTGMVIAIVAGALVAGAIAAGTIGNGADQATP